MKPVSRSSGRSAVAAAAYRAAAHLVDERDGQVHDYSRKDGVGLTDIILPEGREAAWAQDRETLWNAAEAAERRKDARVAREFEVALPEEVAPPEREELARSFAEHLANRYGTAVDLAVHEPSRSGDRRNHHAHLLMTVREVGPEGFGGKTEIERENRWLKAEGLPVAQEQLREIRRDWERLANGALEAAGLDIRLDCRSHSDRGLHILPSAHVGVHATQMERTGQQIERPRLDAEARQINAEIVRERPEDLLELLTAEKSVFTVEDIHRALWRCSVRPGEIAELVKPVLASPALVELQAEPLDMPRGSRPARYTTQEMLDIETGMADRAQRMATRGGFGMPAHELDEILRGQGSSGGSRLDPGQGQAVRHLADEAHIAAVTGPADEGRAAVLGAARATWEAAGRKVLGATVSDRAAEALEAASGIASRTLASRERDWVSGHGGPGRGDVLVIDGADMLGSRQLARFVTTAEDSGAKLVLTGEDRLLQATGPGAAFRAIAELIGAVDLDCARRQREAWQREASAAFATRRTIDGLDAYAERDRVKFLPDAAQARLALAATFVEARRQEPSATQVALARDPRDVRALNELIRAELREKGMLGPVGEEIVLRTDDGPRGFVDGDRALLLETDVRLGVQDGSLGTVERLSPSRMRVRLDAGREVTVPVDDYRSFDHGYAVAVQRARGVTVDRACVLASDAMDRHLVRVAMTRHRDEATLFADRETFGDIAGLSDRLSRPGRMETTLDYLDARAEPLPSPDREADPLRRTPYERALIGYGQAAASILRNREKGLEPLEGQRKAFWTASARLEEVRPGAADRLNAALKRDKRLQEDVPGLAGKALSGRLKDAVAAQESLERSPAWRLERFVERWNETVAEQEKLYEDRKVGLRNVRGVLKELSRDLDRDPTAKALLASGAARLTSGREVPQAVVEGLLREKLPESTERLVHERATRERSRAAQRSMSAERD